MRSATVADLPPSPPGMSGWPWTEGSAQGHTEAAEGHGWPKVSVVTPTLNQGRFIEATIRSVILQGYPDIEYIVVDGGSTDNTAEIVSRYGPWIDTRLSEPDNGQSDAINKGFGLSSGAVLAWLNSDDTYEPGALLRVGAFFRDNPGADVVYGDTHIIDGEGRVIRELRDVPFSRRALAYGSVNINQASTFWRREAFFELGTLDTTLDYAMDEDLWLRFSRSGAKFIHVPSVVASYRHHPAAKSVVDNRQAVEERRMVRHRALGIRERSLGYLVLHGLYKVRKGLYLVAQGDSRYMARKVAGWLRLKA